jgi:antitoxin (DNA-binding transcriptional repressor) of toxin-antitoxin stability system
MNNENPSSTPEPGSPTSQPEPGVYAEFPSITSKEAREKLPDLIDAVADSGTPVVIRKAKMGRARAALIPVRKIGIHAMLARLGMDGSNVNKPVDELMLEVYGKIKHYLKLEEQNGLESLVVTDQKPVHGGELGRKRDAI